MPLNPVTVSRRTDSLLVTHTVLRNTYMLLALTLLFSAVTATVAVVTRSGLMNPLLMVVGMYGLLFLTHATARSGWGLLSVFAFTGFMGYCVGGMIQLVSMSLANGMQLVITSLGATSMIFFALSGYVLATRRDFSFMGGFLFIALMAVLVAIVANLFLQIPMLHLMISAAFVLIASGLILFQTSAIIHGGETNYILATIGLYVSLYNLFISLLQLFMAFSGRE